MALAYHACQGSVFQRAAKGKPQTTPQNRASRQRGDRFRQGDNPSQQFEELEEKQRKLRKRKRPDAIQSIEKSRRREQNRFDRIKDLNDLEDVFDS